MIKFIIWLKSGFENKEGKVCSKRLSTFAFVIFYAWALRYFMVHCTVFKYNLYALILTALVFALLVGVITSENLIKLLRIFKGNESNDSGSGGEIK